VDYNFVNSEAKVGGMRVPQRSRRSESDPNNNGVGNKSTADEQDASKNPNGEESKKKPSE
jgi:hypothetical protein